LLKGYTRLGVATVALRCGIDILLRHKSIHEATSTVSAAVIPKLREHYSSIIKSFLQKNDNDSWKKNLPSKNVWIYWRQGFETAPVIVKRCVDSAKRFLIDNDITLLTAENISQYVTLPDYIEEKHKKGIIPEAHYSDILRLEFLTKYGGLWLDATVLMTGNDFPKEMLESKLFLFQQLNRGEDNRFSGISNWMICSVAGHPLLETVKETLCLYWKENDCLLEYYIFHLFFAMAVAEKPEYMDDVPRYSNRTPHLLQRRLADNYDEQWMQELKRRAWFHKLTYRLPKGAESEGTFYDKLINKDQI
jgi:hypothetical protein